MKKGISIIILIFACSVLNAQKISFGTELGIISSTNVNKNISQSNIDNRRHTYYNGLNVNYSFNKKIEFTTGLHYLRQGYRHSTCFSFPDGVKNELVGKFDYLIVPTALNVNIGKANKLSATIGVFNGLNVKAAQDYPEPIGGCRVHYPSDLSDTTEEYLFGGIIGVGYNLYTNDKIQLKSNIKYYHGLNNIMKNPYSDINFWNDRYSSLLVSVSLSYAFE